MTPPARQPVARVLFDEAHAEAWTIRPEVAREIQPAHPEDSSYALAARGAARPRPASSSRTWPGRWTRPRSREPTCSCSRTPPTRAGSAPCPAGRRVLSAAELDAIEAFVDARRRPRRPGRGGAGQVREQPQRARRALRDHDRQRRDLRLRELGRRAALGARRPRGPARTTASICSLACSSACFYRAGRLETSNGAIALARSSPTASTPGATLLAATEHGAGRVVVAADSDLFGDDCLASRDHEDLWCNLVLWAAGGAFRRPAPRHAVARPPPTRTGSRCATPSTRIRACQRADGSIDLDEHDASRLERDVERCADAVRGARAALPARPRVPRRGHRRSRAWADGGFERPDFGSSLNAFHPEAHRTDGIEHLVAVSDVQAERLARHRARGAARARAVAGVARAARGRALRQPEVRADHAASATPPATTASARRSSPRRWRSPARPRITSARSSATARPSASAAR